MLNDSSKEFQAVCEPLYSSTTLGLVKRLMEVVWTKHCWLLFPKAGCGVPHLVADLTVEV